MGTDAHLQEVLVWDSDPDFIEYKRRVEKPKGTVAESFLNKKLAIQPPNNSAPVFVDTSVLGLPEFARASWVALFLPTLYHRFGIAINPWETFTKGNKMLKIIQQVVNVVYPGNTYHARWGDKICSAV